MQAGVGEFSTAITTRQNRIARQTAATVSSGRQHRRPTHLAGYRKCASEWIPSLLQGSARVTMGGSTGSHTNIWGL